VSVTRWIRATFLGWILGVPLVALFAIIGENVRFGGAYVWVGLGMGAGVGIMQQRVLRTARWALACALGLALPMLAADILRKTGHETRYGLQVALALGGIAVGVLQARVLRFDTERTVWWTLASVVGWSAAAAFAVSADVLVQAHRVAGLAGAGAYLGLVVAGGLALGITTGLALTRLRSATTPNGSLPAQSMKL
jgi:hypothetical protein